MKAQQLKNAILQLAISGKLVPQDPNDEPASELLCKIQAEKDRLIAEGKIKKSKKSADKAPYSKIEPPFDIPESWVWVRLGDVLTVSSGKNLNQKQMTDNGKYPVYGGNGITGFYDDFLVKKGTLVIGRVGFYCGSAHKVIFDSWVTDNALIVYPMGNIFNSDYLCYLLNFLDLKKSSVATAQPVISGQRIYKEEIPLPPLNEQHRIVAKIEELLPFIEQQLTALNKNFPEQLKKSILQAAIQGKLTEQLPTDEPASELLKRIQVEKARLISEKKLKKPKHTSEIIIRDNLAYEIKDGVERCIADEIPFEIPESWCWVRLNYLGEIIGGGTPKTTDNENWDNGIIDWLTPADMKFISGKYVDKSERKITEKGLKSSSARILSKNSIVYSSRAPIGYIAITKKELCTSQGFKSIDFYLKDFCEYIYYCLISLTPEIQSRASGTTFKEISGSEFGMTLIPFPPLKEQKRIINKIEQLLSNLQKLE